MVQEVLNPGSGLYRFRPDVVVLAPDWRDWTTALSVGASTAEVEARLAEQVAQFAGLWDRLKSGAGCKIMQHALVPPARHYRGLADRRSPASLANQVATLNDKLFEAAGERVNWIEVDQLAAVSGVRDWPADRHYFASRLPFDPQYLTSYVAFFRAAWRVSAARVKKVLALDLDNTLWGGVIGDDGVEGIKLGPGSSAGEAVVDWGQYVKQLASRGVILAVCSKNNPRLAAAGFEHTHAALKADDFAAMEISWDEAAFDRYMEKADKRLTNLQGQFERDWEQWRRRDAGSDVKMTDYVLAHYKRSPMFYTWGHVSGEATKEIALQLLTKSQHVLGRKASDLTCEACIRRSAIFGCLSIPPSLHGTSSTIVGRQGRFQHLRQLVDVQGFHDQVHRI